MVFLIATQFNFGASASSQTLGTAQTDEPAVSSEEVQQENIPSEPSNFLDLLNSPPLASASDTPAQDQEFVGPETQEPAAQNIQNGEQGESATLPAETSLDTSAPRISEEQEQPKNSAENFSSSTTNLPELPQPAQPEPKISRQLPDLNQEPLGYEHAALSNEAVDLAVPSQPQQHPFSLAGKVPGLEPLKFVPLNLNDTATPDIRENKIVIPNAFEGTDLEYNLTDTGIKENIILKDQTHPKTFSYLINLDDYDYKQISASELAIYKKGKNFNPLFKLYTLSAPLMSDAAGRISSRLTFETNGNELTLLPDADWLANASYPVTVDPNVEISVLNVHSHPVEGELWNIDFTTQGTADLTITPADQATV